MYVLLGLLLVVAFLAYAGLAALAIRHFWTVPADFSAGVVALSAIRNGPEASFSLGLLEVEDGL